ncbi:hypothetical protein AVEN_46947-1 [Araneus ventricosus]|uniref:Uncharacterized protein n=1 Tax=Araneus ventricosus TaxID=182803 RepID=A0A4Y2FKY6_ARAVE|nr:hypothetical protein AVEN_46947-1 [Araneus ventricosus]
MDAVDSDDNYASSTITTASNSKEKPLSLYEIEKAKRTLVEEKYEKLLKEYLDIKKVRDQSLVDAQPILNEKAVKKLDKTEDTHSSEDDIDCVNKYSPT